MSRRLLVCLVTLKHLAREPINSLIERRPARLVRDNGRSHPLVQRRVTDLANNDDVPRVVTSAVLYLDDVMGIAPTGPTATRKATKRGHAR